MACATTTTTTTVAPLSCSSPTWWVHKDGLGFDDAFVPNDDGGTAAGAAGGRCGIEGGTQQGVLPELLLGLRQGGCMARGHRLGDEAAGTED